MSVFIFSSKLVSSDVDFLIENYRSGKMSNQNELLCDCYKKTLYTSYISTDKTGVDNGKPMK